MVEMTAPAGLANCDFNGDGKVTKADGQALLDYVTGVLDSISNKDNADFDNDGSIDTYDAYLFFQQLNKSTVEIPANGSIHVEVNAKVLGLTSMTRPATTPAPMSRVMCTPTRLPPPRVSRATAIPSPSWATTAAGPIPPCSISAAI